jgi:hypothetical protein
MSIGKIVAGVAIGAVLLAYPIAYGVSDRDITCTVTEKDRSSDGEGGSLYRIYTEECGVLSNEDSLLQFKWNSADVQSKVKVGETYTFNVNGWRVPFFSSFPNVDTVEPVK